MVDINGHIQNQDKTKSLECKCIFRNNMDALGYYKTKCSLAKYVLSNLSGSTIEFISLFKFKFT